MSVYEAVSKAAIQVLGLEEADLAELWELDLWDEGLIDSLGIVALIAKIEGFLEISIDLRKLKPENMLGFSTLKIAIENL